MENSIECKHGDLARKCEICDMEAQLKLVTEMLNAKCGLLALAVDALTAIAASTTGRWFSSTAQEALDKINNSIAEIEGGKK